jgi:hypothetical protein
VNKKRVERIGRREGLKVPQRQPKRGQLWLNDGSCIRLRPERANHVWAYDFVEDRTHDGRKIRMLNIVDEFSREALAIRVERRLNSNDVIDVLSDLFILRGLPAPIRSDNGPEFIAKAVQAWITGVGAQTAYRSPLFWRRTSYPRVKSPTFRVRWRRRGSRACVRRRCCSPRRLTICANWIKNQSRLPSLKMIAR